MTRVLVAGWIGSTNLGDELVLSGLLRHLRALGASPVAVSVDPAGTRAVHGTDAVGVPQVPAATRTAGAVVLGGGGLLQDETSPFNLPYHLGRTAPARALRRPVAGVGLGAGRLTTRTGRALVRAALRGVPLTVRDAPSADLLQACGLPRPQVTADLALGLPPVEVAAQDRLVVCLRPWSGGGGRLPVGLRRARPPVDDPALDRTAAELDAVAAATGLAVHLVALQADRDGPLHDAVAARMRTPATTARPDLEALPAEVASGRVVLAQRFHGGVCAVLAGRPVVLVGYSPKVDALAADLGAAARLLPWSPAGLAGAVAAVQAVAATSSAEGRERLRAREAGNRTALERLFERAQPR
ncbi:MAG TPA: polysaccharide pyruvyl transferase family protein [Mycobacteriales bacterium]|nr:polysaccharide pyruvyl transferase family protein [Mycobacteriales bacterium]